MKRSYFFKIVVIFAFSCFLSCDNEDETIDTATIKIIGTWKLEKKSINDSEVTLSECDKKETYIFDSSIHLTTNTYSGDLCDSISTSNWVYDITNNILSYSNQTAGHNGSEFTRRFHVIDLSDDTMELELFYEVDGIGEEGDLQDKTRTIWVK